MKPKHQRLIFIAASVACLCVATLMVLGAFRDNLVFFYSPSELAAKTLPASQMLRVGGLVEQGSVQRGPGDLLRFTITDGKAGVPVRYQGLPPTLFREGQGVVAEGNMVSGELAARRILAKHDENYMPREVVDALKKSGRWQEGAAPPP